MQATEMDRRARLLLDLFDRPGPAARQPDLDVATAYAVAGCIRELRQARGEVPLGRKIGFTNTTILERYGMTGPMWAPVYDTTLHDAATAAPLDPDRFSEPRIEPEIAFRLSAPPTPGMGDDGLIGCIGAVSFGFEIVQSVFPGWRFSAAESIASQGLHGALYAGPWHEITGPADWVERLADFTVALLRDGQPVDRGHARNVLGGPLKALGFLVETLASQPDHPPLAAGEVITTGTLTDASPIEYGQVWTARLSGLPLPDVSLSTSGRP